MPSNLVPKQTVTSKPSSDVPKKAKENKKLDSAKLLEYVNAQFGGVPKVTNWSVVARSLGVPDEKVRRVASKLKKVSGRTKCCVRVSKYSS